MQPLVASQRKRGSSTEPAFAYINQLSSFLSMAQKLLFCNSVVLNRQRDAFVGAGTREILAETTLWSDKGHVFISTLCISEYEA